MAWQEELRKIEEELASGRMTAEVYRIRRDSVLSAAAASGEMAAPNPVESTQLIPPVTGGPPPQQAGQGNADRTQVVPTSDSPADKTQVVSETDVGNAQRTQMVRPGWNTQGQDRQSWGQPIPGIPPQQGVNGPPSPPRGFQPRQPQPGQQQQGWDSAGNDTGTPWGGSEFPPLNQYANEDWIKQGPEAFAGSSSSGSKKWLVIVAVIVVVVGIGVGGYFAFFNKTSGGNTPPQASTTTSTPAPAPPDGLQIAKLPGNGANPTGKASGFADIPKPGLLTDGEVQTYQAADAGTSRLAVAGLSGNIQVTVLTVRTSSEASAQTAVNALVALQSIYGLSPYNGAVPSGVTISQIAAGQYPATIRAHYAAKNAIVRVQVSGPTLAAIDHTFDRILAAQLAALPATGADG